MGSSRFLLTIAVVVVGGWFLLDRYEIRGLQELKLIRRNRAEDRGMPPAARTQGTVRIASFNLEAFGPTKAGKPDVMEIIAGAIRRFDVVALQEIRTERPDVLQKLLTQVNATGRHYALLAGPRVGRTASKEQFAFVFDQATIEVDRSAAYMARYMAKNVVAAGLAGKCEVQLAYAIGVAQPVSINVTTFGTGKVGDIALGKMLKEHFDCRPAAIIETLQLRRPQYRKTAGFGHFGREDQGFRWEETDQAAALRNKAGI